MDTMDDLSMDLERANLDTLRGVFPECFVEGKLDIDKLLGLCGEYIDNDFEKSRFEWKGKAGACGWHRSGPPGRCGPALRRAWTGNTPGTST